ncbi:MAG: efflux RND transporter periplasmic adaptor subunit [Myxococcota bacterium]
MPDALKPLLGRAPGCLVLLVVAVLAFGAGSLLSGGGETAAPHAGHAADTVWTCAMHPQIRQSEPGACPICGMDLIPAGGASSSRANDQVVLSDRARRLAQLRTEPVRRQGGTAAEVRLLGRVEPDESTQKAVTTWIGGRIDRLHVSTTGEQVRKGQVIATLYSPEVYAAQQDLLTARKQVDRLGDASATAASAARAALSAAEDRLRLLGVPDDELARMATAERPQPSVPIRSPFGGTVIERVATEGAYVQTGSPLYRVADLSKLWIQLDAYESDLPRLQLGQEVSLQVEAIPGQTFEGRVGFVDPTLDPQRRTARVRVEVGNPDGLLRPGMFAEATVFTGEASDEAPLVVPASAPLFTGQRSVVYVELRDEETLAYAPRTVRLGPRLGDYYPVVAGLSEGDRVVTRGAFALDADLQIRGGPSMMSQPDDLSEGPWASVVPLPSAERDRLAPVVRGYLAVQRALAEDDHAAAVEAASSLVPAIEGVTLEKGAAAWAELAPELRGHAQHVARSPDLEGARAGFEPLSEAVEGLLRTFGNPLDAELHVAFCPMADDNRGARWVQQGQTIDNSYFGASMRQCGEIRSEIAPGGFLPGSAPAAPRPAPAGHVH